MVSVTRDNFTKRLYENCVTEPQLTRLYYAYIWRRNKHCTWKPSWNSWQLRPHWNAINICRQGKTKAYCSKESTGPTVSSQVGEPNPLHAKKLPRLPGSVRDHLRRCTWEIQKTDPDRRYWTKQFSDSCILILRNAIRTARKPKQTKSKMAKLLY